MSGEPPQPQRPAVDMGSAQLGETRIGQAAGNSITNTGADPNSVLDFLRSYVFEADQKRETGIKALNEELKRIHGDMDVLSDALRTVRHWTLEIVDSRLTERGDRERRQGVLDGELARLRRGQIVTRLIILGVAGAGVGYGLWISRRRR